MQVIGGKQLLLETTCKLLESLLSSVCTHLTHCCKRMTHFLVSNVAPNCHSPFEHGIIITSNFPHLCEGVIPRRCYYGFVRRKSWWALASTLLCSIWAEVCFLPNHSGWLSSTRHCRWTSLSFRYSTCAVSSIRNLIETVRHELCSMPASTFSFFLLKTNIWEIDHFAHFSHLFSLSYLKTIFAPDK